VQIPIAAGSGHQQGGDGDADHQDATHETNPLGGDGGRTSGRPFTGAPRSTATEGAEVKTAPPAVAQAIRKLTEPLAQLSCLMAGARQGR
jgi:hypothetical protein